MKKRSGNLSGLVDFPVEFRSLKMTVAAEKELQIEAHSALTRHWRELQQYLSRHPEFGSPHPIDREDLDVPDIVRIVQEACMDAQVAPCLVFDGALTDMVAKELRAYTKQLLIENGPEVFVLTDRPRSVRIFAGDSPLSSRLVLEVSPEICPAGLSTHCCTENVATRGREKDAAIAVSNSATVAAAYASGAGERISAGDPLAEIQNWAFGNEDVLGLLLIRGDMVSKRGAVHVVGG